MPYIYAHALTGYYVLKNCKNADRVGIPSRADAFFLGTMGPDPYYGDSYPPPLCGKSRFGLADWLHALDGRALFAKLLALSEGSEALTSYTMGFLCHFLLDNHTHPYIEARFSGKRHTPAEIAFDPMLLARANEPTLCVSPAAFFRTDAKDEIDALHAALFASLGEPDARGIYARSLHKWIRLNALLYDPSGRKRRFTRALPHLSQYFLSPREDENDLLNLSHAPWSDSDARTASLPELAAAAEREACRLIERIAAGETETALCALEGRSADAAGHV